MSSFRLEDALEFSSRNVGPDDLDWDVGPRRRIEGAERFRWGGFIDTGSLLSQRYPEDAFQRKLPDSNTPGLSIKEQRMIQAAKDELREAEQACRKVLCQRYIDDLESCIYLLVFLVSRGVFSLIRSRCSEYRRACRFW